MGQVAEIDVEQVAREWAGGPGAESTQKKVAPFQLRHYVIGLVASLILLVWVWSSASFWHLVPMMLVAFTFMACVMATETSSDQGWWPHWWLACAAAGYVVFCGLVLLVNDISETTKCSRSCTPLQQNWCRKDTKTGSTRFVTMPSGVWELRDVRSPSKARCLMRLPMPDLHKRSLRVENRGTRVVTITRAWQVFLKLATGSLFDSACGHAQPAP